MVQEEASLAALIALAKARGARIHLDGARLSNAVAAGFDPKAVTRLGVDVLVLGGTKAGSTPTEAIVLFDRTLSHRFGARLKHAGQLISKTRFLAAPWIGMLESGAWAARAAHANAMAARLAAGLASVRGVRLVQKVQANELFVAMPDGVIEALLTEGFEFYRWTTPAGASGPVIRLVTSFCTAAADVDAFVAATSRYAIDQNAPA